MSEAPPVAPAPRRGRAPGVGAAAVAAALAFLAGFVPRGTPETWDGRRAWEGVGPHLDLHLPARGVLRFERIRRASDGTERRIDARASLGGVLASVGVYLLALPPLGLWLRRRGPVRLRPEPRDVDALLSALAGLVPVFVLGGLALAFWSASTDGGRLLRAAVYGFCLPALGDSATAALPLLRLVVLAPLVEELLWRGIVYRGLRARLAFGPASVATAFLFGLWHVFTGWEQTPALVAQYTFGLVACWLVERTGGLGAAVLLHALGNAAAIGLYALAMFAPERVLGLFGVS